MEPRARREEQMVREIRTLFSDAAIRNFRDDTLTGELTKLHLPLVHRNKVIAAIKPLAFDQAEPSAILDHCEQWVIRLARAESEGILKLENVLIPVTAPYSEQTKTQRKAVDAAKQCTEPSHISVAALSVLPVVAACAALCAAFSSRRAPRPTGGTEPSRGHFRPPFPHRQFAQPAPG